MLKRFGTEYGGFYYPENLDGLNSDSIIYCVGAGEDITHDIEIAHKLDSKVYVFDPTPRAINHVKYVKDVLDNNKQPINNKRYGGGDPNYWDIIMKNKIGSDKIELYEYGLYTRNDNLKFYKQTNPEYISHTLVENMFGDEYIEVPVKNLKTIMNELNHDRIDLLKIDIEGVENEVLEQMMNENIYPKYLSVDFDSIRKYPHKCNNTVNKLISKGYKILKISGQDVSFILNKI
jgi:FkbM family methyltransferase